MAFQQHHIHAEETELHVPHLLLCGQRPGPTVLISAGIHNAEYVGIHAAIELSNELDGFSEGLRHDFEQIVKSRSEERQEEHI